MSTPPWAFAGWILAACLLGFSVTYLLAGRMKLSRNRFLVVYIPLTGLFFYLFAALSPLPTAFFTKNWLAGLLVGALTGFLLVRQVRTQPFSRRVQGRQLAAQLGWAGLAYGLADALFLNVLPVLAVQSGLSTFPWAGSVTGRLATGLLALAASLLVALVYHLGFPEYRNPSVKFALIGNTIITLAFLLSGSPLGSLISHPAMHIAAVFQGAETTVQLPPHPPSA